MSSSFKFTSLHFIFYSLPLLFLPCKINLGIKAIATARRHSAHHSWQVTAQLRAPSKRVRRGRRSGQQWTPWLRGPAGGSGHAGNEALDPRGEPCWGLPKSGWKHRILQKRERTSISPGLAWNYNTVRYSAAVCSSPCCLFRLCTGACNSTPAWGVAFMLSPYSCICRLF